MSTSMDQTEVLFSDSVDEVSSVVYLDNFPELWKENPVAIQYLGHLSSFGIQRLTQEPERLSEEKCNILEQTQELAFHNYKTFIQTADCSREIYEDFTFVEHRLQALLDKVPRLNEQCQEFSEKTQEINRRWHQSSVMLSKHAQLLEILEIPQIMDTCVRNAYFEEALELAAYVQHLEKKHTNIPLIRRIAGQVEMSQQLMLSQLLQSLRLSIKLPDCLRLVNNLRRISAFSETQLRIKFLQARDAWFQGLLSVIPTDDTYVHISKVMELSRVHLFDIITQYRAVFTDDDPMTLLNKDKMHTEANIFHSWLMLKISQFLEQLVTDLWGDVSSRLDSLLSQSMYFGLSFSRVGVDFRPLLVTVFQNAILTRFREATKETTLQFEQSMESFTFLRLPNRVPNSLLTSTLNENPSLQPPLGLLQFPPLAVYCNGILGALNDLRLCTPLTLAPAIILTLKNSLEKVVAAVVHFQKAEEKSLTQAEQTSLVHFCLQLSSQLLPHLNSCLATLFPPTQVATLIGVTLNDLLTMGDLNQLDLKAILVPMSYLMLEEEGEEDEGMTIVVPTLLEPIQHLSEDTAVSEQSLDQQDNIIEEEARNFDPLIQKTDTSIIQEKISDQIDEL